jgi:hypothetical protein
MTNFAEPFCLGCGIEFGYIYVLDEYSPAIKHLMLFACQKKKKKKKK